ncbi:phage minor capsid protein [Nocardiopsis changdeensis]|uniref:Minor capsid protein n=1 Tax=Nocardiopsis changdeensis TaxID=2831969 RepID=A0ABX8BQ89_9ACTN|nr:MULTISPECIES: phage minor capsid protein [Nocardiopsis]QUX22986.1 hypothetical protein KGD84_00815 [Nocardiopsis changdeensis]QYX38929.1 hypothetical protein K1J57_10265 [Nocardiopsis sp. MT53]
MPGVNPDDVDEIVANVAAIYREGELALLREIRDHLREHPGAPTAFAQPRADALASLRRAAGAVQTALTGNGSTALRQAVADAWRLGTRAAVADLPAAWFPASGLSQAAEAARDLVPQQGAIQALAAALVRDVGQVVQNILRDTLDAYRSAIAGATARMLAGGQTRRDATQAAWAALVNRGILGFTDRSGRRWRLSSYVEMATRTASARAAVEGQTSRLEDLGVKYVYVSDHAQECQLCRPWEGKILFRGEATVGTAAPNPLRPRAWVTVHPAGTLAEARAAGLFHPNCRHSVSAYLPGVTQIPRATAQPEQYKARMRQREIERKIRKWKEQEAAATTDEAKKAARRKVLDWQREMRKHLDDHPELKRLRYREQIGAGSTPPGGDTSNPATPLGPDVQPDLFNPAGGVRAADQPRQAGPLLAVNPAPNPAEEAHRQQLEAARQAARSAAQQARSAPLGPGFIRLGDLIPDDYDDALNREDEIRDALTDVLESRDYNGFTIAISSTDINEDETQFSADIHSQNDTYVGTVERTFRREGGGILYAIHDYLNLDRSVRGQGFAEAWNGFLERWYRHSGFERIEVHANIDVGGYTWARQGFTWADEHDAIDLANQLERELARAETELASMASDDPDRPGLQFEIAAAEALLDRFNDEPFGSDDYPTAYELSQCGRQPQHTGRDASWIGKRAMLGSDWQGVKWL